MCPLEMCLVKWVGLFRCMVRKAGHATILLSLDSILTLVSLCPLTHFVQHALTTSPLKNATGIFFNRAANSEIPDNVRGSESGPASTTK